MRNDARSGDLVKISWHDTQGMCLFVKRLENGRFVWPPPAEGVVTITPGQLGYLLDNAKRCPWR
jgi:transposase